MTQRLLTATIIAVLLVGGALLLASNLDWLDWPETTSFSVLRAAGTLVVVVLLVGFVLFRPSVEPPTATALGRPVPKAPTKEAVNKSRMSASSSYDGAVVNVFVEMLLDSRRYLMRINEDGVIDEAPRLCMTTRQVYDVGSVLDSISKAEASLAKQDETKRETQQDQRTVEDRETRCAHEIKEALQTQSLLMPLLTVEKGTLLDNFVVRDACGNTVPTIPQSSARGLIVRALEVLFEMMPIEVKDAPAPAKFKARWKRVLAGLAVAICSPGPLNKQSDNLKRKTNAALKAIESLPTTDQWKRRLRDFCRYYIDYYVIVAELAPPTTKHVVLSYSHKMPCESPATQESNLWRGRFGLTPAAIDIPLNLNAFRAGSYHLQVSANTGQYVFDHHLERLDSTEHITQEDLTKSGIDAYARIYYEEGRPNAHLYVRRQEGGPPDELERLKSIIRFREIPPGALGGATVISAASTTLILFFAVTHLGMRIDTNDGSINDQIRAALNSDIPALLLALPAFIAALVGTWTDLSHIRRTSLTTYVALAGTMILSLFSALFFVFDANKVLPTQTTIRLLTGHEVTTDYVWLTLALLSTTLTFSLVHRWIGESRYYFSVVRRRVGRLRRIDKVSTTS